MSRLAQGEIIPTDCLKFSREIERNNFIDFSIEIEKEHLLEIHTDRAKEMRARRNGSG